MEKRWPNSQVGQVPPLTPGLKLNCRQNTEHDSVAEGWNYTMMCRRASKSEPLLRFNPLNLAKIACFAKCVLGAKSVPSDFLYKKVSMILICNILNIKVLVK